MQHPYFPCSVFALVLRDDRECFLLGHNYTSKEGLFNGDGVLYYHRLAEVFKFIFAKRSFLTDECCMNAEEEEVN